MVVFVARHNGQPVATSICFRNNKTLYGRYWGAAERIDRLHFELSTTRELNTACATACNASNLGPAANTRSRGFEPVAVTTLHWIADERMREMLCNYLQRSTDAIEQYTAEASGHLPFRKSR